MKIFENSENLKNDRKINGRSEVNLKGVPRTGLNGGNLSVPLFHSKVGERGAHDVDGYPSC